MMTANQPRQVPTTHVGSLPRSDALMKANRAVISGEIDRDEFEGALTAAVSEVVKRQVEIGISIVNDGEYGKLTTTSLDAGPWMAYALERLNGWEVANESQFALKMRDHDQFADFYDGEFTDTLSAGGSLGKIVTAAFTGPISYTGHKAIERDLTNLRSALDQVGRRDGFVAAISPGSLERGRTNPYYKSREDHLFAIAEALHEEYKAITDAGFTVQLDSPTIADGWEISPPSVTLSEYRKEIESEVAAINRALQGVPREQVRIHVCWGSWHGPHTGDLPLSDFLDMVLEINADGFCVEAGNVRHELDWRAWEHVDLPGNVCVVPGVVSHSTILVESPELVADRIVRYAEILGPERVIAGTDCGLGGRVHPEIAWGKLEALVHGAALASSQLWPVPASVA